MNNFFNLAGKIKNITKIFTDSYGQDMYSANVSMNIKNKHIEVPMGVETTIRPADLSQQQYALKRKEPRTMLILHTQQTMS